MGTNIFRFGDFTLDPSQGLLCKGEHRLRLAPKLIALLTLLVERRGTVVARDEIIRTLWPNTVVEEGGLPRNISMLRKYLDCGDGVQYIENIPKRGYRFAAEVIDVPRSHDVAPAELSSEYLSDVPPPEQEIELDSVNPNPPVRRWNARAVTLAALAVFVAIILSVLVVKPERATSTSWASEPITTNSAALPIIAAGLSPNGRLLAYVEENQADATTYVRELNSPRTHALPPLRSIVPSSIHWYEDNTRLLLNGFEARSRRYVTWSVSILGGPPTMVLEDAHKPSLSPDGRLIAFYRNRKEIWLANSDGTSEKLFATAPDSTRFRLQPHFSADGKYLLVGRVTRLPYSPTIEAHRLSDGEVTAIYDPNGRAIFDMLLLPTNELIVSAIVGYSSSELLSMQVDFNKRTTSAARKLRAFDGVATDLRAAADGKRVSLILDNSQPDIYVGSLDTTGTALLNVRRLTLDNSWDRPSAWLDERTVIFHSNRHGHPGIYKQRIDQLHAEPLVVNDYGNVWPVVTPDQKWLWYYSKLAGRDSAEALLTLTRRPLAGGPAQEFDTRANAWRGLRCASGGRCVRVEREGSESVFYSFDPQDGGGRELFRTPWLGPFAFNWDLAPDGRRIAFVDRQTNAIRIVDLNTKPPRRIDLRIDTQQGVQGVSWSADGAGVYASCFDDDTSSTWHVSLEGHVTLLRHQPSTGGVWAKPSANGQFLLLAESTKASNAWLLERY